MEIKQSRRLPFDVGADEIRGTYPSLPSPFTSVSFRYEPVPQYKSFLSNDELLIVVGVTTATARPRIVAELKRKEQLLTAAVPPSLIAPPTSGHHELIDRGLVMGVQKNLRRKKF